MLASFVDPYLNYVKTFDWRTGVSCGFLLSVVLAAVLIARVTRGRKGRSAP